MNWEYISGFFDADGSISLIHLKNSKNKTVQIFFHNNEKDILLSIEKFIKDELNIKGFLSVKKARKKNHSISFDLKYIYLTKCVALLNNMNTIHPKKKHRKNITFKLKEVTPRNGKYTRKNLFIRKLLEQEFFRH